MLQKLLLAFAQLADALLHHLARKQAVAQGVQSQAVAGVFPAARREGLAKIFETGGEAFGGQTIDQIFRRPAGQHQIAAARGELAPAERLPSRTAPAALFSGHGGLLSRGGRLK